MHYVILNTALTQASLIMATQKENSVSELLTPKMLALPGPFCTGHHCRLFLTEIFDGWTFPSFRVVGSFHFCAMVAANCLQVHYHHLLGVKAHYIL